MATINAQTIINEVMAAHASAPSAYDASPDLEFKWLSAKAWGLFPGAAASEQAHYLEEQEHAEAMAEWLAVHPVPAASVTFKTSARGSHRVKNTQENLTKFADKVRANAAAFGGGLVRIVKARPAVSWPAGTLALFKQMMEDGDHAAALDLAEQKLGGRFYADGLRVAPVPSDNAAGLVSGMRDTGEFQVFEPLSGLTAGKSQSYKIDRSRAAAEKSTAIYYSSLDAEKIHAAIVKAQSNPADNEARRADWMAAHNLSDERTLAQHARTEAIRADEAEAYEQGRAERDAARAARDIERAAEAAELARLAQFDAEQAQRDAETLARIEQQRAASEAETVRKNDFVARMDAERAAQDVAAMLASAQAAAAIEQAQESAQVTELGAMPASEATPVQAEATQAARELETVGEYGGSAGQTNPGTPDAPRGHASAASNYNATQCAAWLAANGLQGQTINSKSGAWRATFFLDHDGKPCMMFNEHDPMAFTSGSARMKALQQLARRTESEATQASHAASPTASPAAGVCPTLPATTTPNQPAPVLKTETPQDASPAPESETPQDAAPVFERFKPINLDPRDLLARGVAAAQLVGLGVNYTGNMANPDGIGAITAASDTRGERMGSLRLTVSLEDGREFQAEPHYFTASLRPICQFNGMMHGAPYLAQLAAAVATVKAQASSAKEQAAKAYDQARHDLSTEYAHLQRAENKHQGGKLAAVNMRTLLKQAFPGHKFSVTSSYNSARVNWTDGPTDAEVTAIIARFDIGASDCQTDYFYTVSTAFSDLFGGVQYLTTRRDASDELVTRALGDLYPTEATRPSVQDWRKCTGEFNWAGHDSNIRRMREHLDTLSAYQAPAAKARKASRA